MLAARGPSSFEERSTAGSCALADGDGNACTGTRSCGANQRWVRDAVSPTPELCTPTDIDEDCDGDTDEDCPF